MDSTQLVGVGIFSSLVAMVSMAVAMWRAVPSIQAKQIKALSEDTYDLKRNAVWCEWRVAMLIAAMHRAGIPVPEEVFTTEEDFWNAREAAK